jgi:hypothetical protein
MTTQASFVTAVIILCVLLSGQGLWAYGGGTGTPEDPYLIYTAEQMNRIGLHPEDWDKHFRLMEDIDLSVYSGNQFHLIGLYRVAQDPNEGLEVPFSGVFDGQGHTIAHFTYAVGGDEDPAQGWVNGFGLFRLINGASAEIKDVTLLDPNLHPSSTCIQRVGAIGALAGVVKSGLITGCHVEGGHIRAEGSAGGLVGSAQRYYIDGPPGLFPTLSHCSTDCAVVRAPARSFIEAEGADRSLHAYYGGMLGFNSGMISDCWATGPVSGGRIAGGLVGRNNGDIMHCRATGEVSGRSSVGGLAGESNGGRISSSWASGDVIGSSEGSPEDASSEVGSLGGLVGSSLHDTVSDCYARGRATGQSHVGGLAGSCNKSNIERCCATGSVSAEDQQAGGLAGSAGLDTVISECYACALVSVPRMGGGLVGLNGGTIRMSWADGKVSGTSAIGGLVGAHWKWRQIVAGYPLEFNGVITDCYVMTDVICEGSRGGGLVGSNEGGTLWRCYAAGKVIGFQDVGGLVGTESEEYPSTVEQSFWDLDATGLGLSAKGIGLSTHQMQDRTTYIEAGWDFTGETLNGPHDIWYMDPDVTMYPRLAWETEPNAFLIRDVNDQSDGSARSPHEVPFRSRLAMYVNGQLAAQRPLTVSGSVFLGDGSLGRWLDPTWNLPRYLNGVLDDVQIYDRALSAEEIQTLITGAAGV